MSPCLVIVSWPDFQGDEAGLARSAPTVAHALWHRYLASDSAPGSVTDRGSKAWVYPGADRSAARAFEQWGFSLLAERPDQPNALLSVPLEASRHVVFAMEEQRAHAIQNQLEMCDDAGILIPGRVGPRASAEVRSIADALHLDTAQPVGLFVDWDCLSRVFRSGHPSISPREVLGRVRQRAELVGSVVQARLYGPWESGPAVDFAGHQSASIPATLSSPSDESAEAAEDALCEDLRRALGDPLGPRTWVLVSDAPWLESMAAQARAAGIRTVHWQPRQDHHPIDAKSEFDTSQVLEVLLDLSNATPHLPIQAIQTVQTVQPVPLSIVERPANTLRPYVDQAPHPVPELPGGSIPIGSQLTAWVRLVYRVEYHLRGNRWRKIPYRKLATLLAEDEEFGPTPAQAQLWLNRAQTEGMLSVTHEAHRTDPTLRVAMCRLNPSHPVTAAALDVPESGIRLLRQMLQKMPWVSFKLLRGVLLREQWLGGPPFGLDETAVDEWLNYLVRDGVLRMTKERNLENPDYPVTALRLNEEHPLCRTVLTQAAEGRRLAAERAILAIDHFTRRNRKPWMAMSALRRALTGMGRDELQEVLQGLQNLGAVVTESYPNPRKEHFTTGCRLKREDPFVQETLKARNQIVRVTEYHQRYRTWVPIQTLEQELHALGDDRTPSGVHSAWLMLLRDEGLLEVDQDGFSADGWSNARCRLNSLDAIVRTILSEEDGPHLEADAVA